MQQIANGLRVRSQFVISGNTKDVFAVGDTAGDTAFLQIEDALLATLRGRGYKGLILHDPLDGFRLHPDVPAEVADDLAAAGVTLGFPAEDLGALAKQLKIIANFRTHPVAVLLDYASLLTQGARGLSRAELGFFVTCDKIARESRLGHGDGGETPFNPILWIVDRQNDLPEWFEHGNESLLSVVAGKPTLEERYAAAKAVAHLFHDSENLARSSREDLCGQLAVETEGMSLRSLLAIAEFAKAEGIALSDVSDAIRSYQFGTRLNPWKSEVMRQRIGNGRKILTARVKGQDHAINKSLDILVRSVTGLSGAQTSSRLRRPRGVLFFAGPTGVGKTELAKAITELLFGDEAAIHRFDMSEFSAENSESRLIGAPPGYEGYDDGGELVNAAKTRPFSVFLFDEIEKAHPLILDKFLQVIDEGRLTDSHGETVNFSESLIIFTSNLGILGGNRATNMGMNITPNADYHETERAIVKAIQDHFRFELKRPELLNRIGQNICVFEFIHGRTARLIFEHMLGKILATVAEEHGFNVVLSDAARDDLLLMCTSDLFDGGRGIGNRLETKFINPLAHLIFRHGPGPKGDLMISRVIEEESVTRLIPG